jgi:acetylornithine deacetylase/succinyl-diaminopimelate desuccinylase-like protein
MRMRSPVPLPRHPRSPTRHAFLAATLATAFAATGVAARQNVQCDAAGNTHCREVTTMAQRTDVQRALRWIEEQDARTVADLIRLTEIPAPPFMEATRARAYADMLREAGADTVWIDEEGNVIALRRGTARGRTLVLSGHLDTVFPEGTDVTVKQRGDTLYAPGIGDDTRGLMSVLTVLRALEATGIETREDVWFVGTVGEEGLGDLRGVKHLFREGGPKIDAFISVDGSGDNRLVNGALGSRRYRVQFDGPGGHSWGAFGTASPIHALGRGITLFDEAAAAFTASGARTSYNVGRIGGGTSVNSVAFEAWMEVDMRSESRESLMAIDSLFQAAMKRALDEENTGRRRGDALTLDLKLVGDRPSGTIDPNHPFLLRARAVTQHLGLEPQLQMSSTDSNIPISKGIPAFTIGGGGQSGNAHAPEEWWLNQRGPLGIQRALLIVLAEAGITGPAT